MPADTSTSIAIGFAGAFALVLIYALAYSLRRLREARALAATRLQLLTVSDTTVRELGAQLDKSTADLREEQKLLEALQFELEQQRDCLRHERKMSAERELEHQRYWEWAERWREQWRRALLAQRWARSAACYEPSDPQRSIYSAAAVALLLSRDVEQVCRVMEQWIVETPKAADGVMERHTAESQAAQHWRVLVNEARDYMRNEVYWFVESEEGKPPPEQPPLEERLWRFLTGESPGRLDAWNVPQLERATLELLARAQLAGVEIAVKRGHPREVAPNAVH